MSHCACQCVCVCVVWCYSCRWKKLGCKCHAITAQEMYDLRRRCRGDRECRSGLEPRSLKVDLSLRESSVPLFFHYAGWLAGNSGGKHINTFSRVPKSSPYNLREPKSLWNNKKHKNKWIYVHAIHVIFYLILIETLHSFNLLCFYNSYGFWLLKVRYQTYNLYCIFSQ